MTASDPAAPVREPNELSLARVCELVGQSTGRIAVQPHDRLIEDLGLDSLELVEVLVALIENSRSATLADEFAVADWRGVSVEQLYVRYVPARGEPT